MKINTDRLIIREFDLNDAQKIYELSREAGIVEFIPDQVYESIETAQKTLMFLISQYKNRTYPLVMAVILRKSNELIGHVGLSEIGEGIEIGYAIGADYQGNGYAKEAVRAYIKWAKENLQLDSVYGVVDKENLASQKVLLASGFKVIENYKPASGKITLILS